jgi:hypothetical protein
VTIVPSDDARAMLENVIGNVTALIALQWLALNRETLRQRWLCRWTP